MPLDLSSSIRKISGKQLGVIVTEASRRPANSPESASERDMQRNWAVHLNGPKLVGERDQILDKYRDPKDAQKAIDDWYNSDVGYVCEHVKIRDLDGNLVPASESIDPYQVDILESRARFSVMMKARRIGGSFGSCMAAVASVCRKQNPISSFFISRNHGEAREKVEIAYSLFQTIPKREKPAMSSRGIKSTLEFRNDNGQIIKIYSHPQTQPRAIEGVLWLDEFGMYQDQVGIYSAAIPAVSIRGSIWLIGTPGSSRDLFADIMENRGGPENRGYPAFNNNRYKIEWWKCVRMVKPGKFDEAQQLAPSMETEPRVMAFGSERLFDIWNARVSLAIFQREEECVYADDADSYYEDELIRACEIQAEDSSWSKTIDFAVGKPVVSLMQQKLQELKIDTTIYSTVDYMRGALAAGRLSGQFVMGIDPGFTDGCVITLVEEIVNHPGVAIVRFQEKWRQRDFNELENRVVSIGSKIPLRMIAIDCKDREGAALAARLRSNPNFGPARVKPVEGTAQSNGDMAIDLHQRLEGILIGLPDYDDLIKDIKKVRRVVQASGLNTIEVKRDKDGHGDRFFSLIYALSCLPKVAQQQPFKVNGLSDYERLKVPQCVVQYHPGITLRRSKEDMLKIMAPKLIIPKAPRIEDMDRIKVPGAFGMGSLPRTRRIG